MAVAPAVVPDCWWRDRVCRGAAMSRHDIPDSTDRQERKYDRGGPPGTEPSPRLATAMAVIVRGWFVLGVWWQAVRRRARPGRARVPAARGCRRRRRCWAGLRREEPAHRVNSG